MKWPRIRGREVLSCEWQNARSAASKGVCQPHGGGDVMDKERNLGVTEARFALTLLTCLLVAIGYVALLRLGGSKDTATDVGPDDASSSSIAGPILPSPPI